MIQFNDVIVELPITFNKLIALGFDYEIDNKAYDYELSKDERVYTHFYLEETEVFAASLINEKADAYTLEECNPEITEITISSTFADVDVYFPGGIRIGDSSEAIDKRLGTPAEITTDMITYEVLVMRQTVCGMRIQNDKDSKQITSIRMIKNQEFSDITKFEATTISGMACVADGTKQSLSLQFVQGYTSNNQDLYTVFELDGNIYSMKLSASVEALRNAKEFTADEMLYKETDPAGVSRTLGFVEGIGYQYQVIKGYYVFNGQIQLTDMSTNKAVNIYENEDLINCVTSIVKSMR